MTLANTLSRQRQFSVVVTFCSSLVLLNSLFDASRIPTDRLKKRRHHRKDTSCVQESSLSAGECSCPCWGVFWWSSRTRRMALFSYILCFLQISIFMYSINSWVIMSCSPVLFFLSNNQWSSSASKVFHSVHK